MTPLSMPASTTAPTPRPVSRAAPANRAGAGPGPVNTASSGERFPLHFPCRWEPLPAWQALGTP